MTPQRVWNCRRSAYTLAEMLIVVTIMIMLVAAALPMAKKVMEGSQGREASRQLNAYFAMAKARALQSGRPCGIYFAFPSAPLGVIEPTLTPAQYAQYWPVRQVTQLYLAETPAPYSGSTTSARGKITLVGSNYAFTTGDTTEDGFLSSLLDSGEEFLVRFNCKGDWYICKNTSTTSSASFSYVGPFQSTAQPPVQPYGYGNPGATGVPFEILRSPRPVGNPLMLPQGTCIDITYSGVGHSSRQFPIPSAAGSPLTGLTVLLAPNGAIDSMYLDTLSTRRIPMAFPIGSLYFLIGKTEKAGNPNATNIAISDPTVFANPDDSNLADRNSLWVIVNRGTGQVITAENMPPPIDRTTLSASNITIFPNDPAGRQQNFSGQNISAAIGKYVFYCRQAATSGEQMTGR